MKGLLRIHNLLYRVISKFATRTEGGVHPKHQLMNYHQFFLDHIAPTDSVLDLGCGNGALAYDVAKKAKRVVGIDNNTIYRQDWEYRFARPNLTYDVADAMTYSPLGTFDVVILSNILEHLSDRIGLLKSIQRLAPKFLIRVPMINRDWITLYKKELGVEYRLDKTHYIEYTIETFQDELTMAGLALDLYSIQFGEIWAMASYHP